MAEEENIYEILWFLNFEKAFDTVDWSLYSYKYFAFFVWKGRVKENCATGEIYNTDQTSCILNNG